MPLVACAGFFYDSKPGLMTLMFVTRIIPSSMSCDALMRVAALIALICITLFIQFSKIWPNTKSSQPLSSVWAFGLLHSLVEPMGIEPTTSGLQSLRSPS